MSILQPPITTKEQLLKALQKADDISNIQVFENVVNGSQLDSYIRWCGDFGNVKHSVVILTKKEKYRQGLLEWTEITKSGA
jgi:hypothetical protein